MLHEWCSDQWSPRVFGTHSQWDNICHRDRKPFLFDVTHPIIISFMSTRVISYFSVRKPMQEEYEDKIILKIELTVVASSWDLSGPEFSTQEQWMFDYRRPFVSPTTPAKGTIIYQHCDITCLWCCISYGWWQLCHCAGKFCHWIIFGSSKN